MQEKNSNLWSYDVEVYKNLFCVTFYNHVTGEKKIFEISVRKNDQPALEKFILETKDLWLLGYNNSNYDDLIIVWLIKETKKYKSYEDLCYNLWLFSNDVIQKTNIYNLSSYKYHDLFNTINLQKVLYLDKVPFKSLKACAVNLKWPKIQDLPIPFDKAIEESEIDLIIEYNLNDVLITNELRKYSQDILTLRKDLSKHYKLNLMNESNSSICDRILQKEYSLVSGEALEDFKNKRSIRDEVSLDICIFWGNIRFRSPELNAFLDFLSKKTIKVGKKEDNEEKSKELAKIKIGNTTHVVGLGGLHSETTPSIYRAGIKLDKNDVPHRFYIKTCDVASYYPRCIINHGIFPAHLKSVIVRVIESIAYKRLEAKRAGRTVEAEGLKIVINSFFGKFLSKFSWLFDPLAGYKVTINCQLYLLMLIEELERRGISVISSNTDGLECMVRDDQVRAYNDILRHWQENTNFQLEVGDYESLIFRDINCYYAVSKTIKNGQEILKIKEKGNFETQKTINKSTDFAIIYRALREYFINRIPIEDTIKNATDILDFCASQKVGGDMKAELHTFDKNQNKTITALQKTNRYFISNEGGFIFKRKKLDSKDDISNQLSLFDLEKVEEEQLISMVANEKVIVLNNVNSLNPNDYDIKYGFYFEECYKIIDLIESSERKPEKKENKQLLMFR